MNDNEIKVSQLAEAEELNENDIFMIVQAGVNKKLQGRKIGGNEIVISTTEEDITSKTKLFINSLTSEAKYRDGSDWISLAGDEVIIGTESDITDNTKILIEEVPEGSNIPYLNSEIAIGSSNEDNRPVWFKQSKNLFNKDNILSGYYIDASGNLISAPDNYVGNDFIKIDNTKTYYVSGGQNNVIRICYYTTSQTFISRELITSSGILTIPNNTMYVKISSYTSNLSTLQLEQNSTATTYEPYIVPSIIANDTDFYSRPVVLWNNSAPTSDFASQTITLSDNINNYSYYEIIYKATKDSIRAKSTGKIMISLGSLMDYTINYLGRRTGDAPNGTSIAIQDCLTNGTYGANPTTTNDRVIPLQVIGYK